MKSIRIIPPKFGDAATELQAEPITIPAGATFPDGSPITAYRVLSALMIENSRLYALRFGAELFIFAHAEEAATITATLLTAQVDNGFQITLTASAYLAIGGNREGSAKQ